MTTKSPGHSLLLVIDCVKRSKESRSSSAAAVRNQESLSVRQSILPVALLFLPRGRNRYPNRFKASETRCRGSQKTDVLRLSLNFSRSLKRQDRSSKLHKRSRLNSSDGLRDQSDEDKSGNSRSPDGEKIVRTIQADFDFCEPNPSYFHGLKVLLPTYLGNKQWDLSGFVDLILEQTTVGTIIKIDGDDTPYCFITALNFGKYKDHNCIQEVKAFLLNVCKEKETLQNLRSLLEEQATSVGLIVCQRVVNLPHQLLPPLYDTLFDEITHAIENKKLAGSFCFKHFIVITRIYEHRNGSREEAARRSSEEATIYTKAEDEIFLELSQWSFKFPLHTGKPANRKLRNYRLLGLVMAIEADKISRFREQLHSWIDES